MADGRENLRRGDVSKLDPLFRRRGLTEKIRRRGTKDQHLAWRILYAREYGKQSEYDPDHHPEALRAYFQGRLDEVEDALLYVTERGDAKYVAKPVRPPTLAAFAVQEGVDRHTVNEWAGKHPEFERVVQWAKAVQEQVLVELGTLGALDPRITSLALKNLQGWMEKADVQQHGTVTLVFDSQDEEA